MGVTKRIAPKKSLKAAIGACTGTKRLSKHAPSLLYVNYVMFLQRLARAAAREAQGKKKRIIDVDDIGLVKRVRPFLSSPFANLIATQEVLAQFQG